MRVLVPPDPDPWHLTVASLFNFNISNRGEARVHFGSILHFPGD